jgi:hypothetical protein
MIDIGVFVENTERIRLYQTSEALSCAASSCGGM